MEATPGAGQDREIRALTETGLTRAELVWRLRAIQANIRIQRNSRSSQARQTTAWTATASTSSSSAAASTAPASRATRRAGGCRPAWWSAATSPAPPPPPPPKLIHGGLRYLEQYEFRLVREALAEREVLLRIAPHIVWPMRFVLPHRPEMRPRWMIRAGLFLYDHLARRVVAAGRRERAAAGASPMASRCGPSMTAAFAYSDCWVEDSRLVLLNARDAAAARRRGAGAHQLCR